MKRKQEIFYAKILLFGEYSVIQKSKGLIVPYAHFRGELAFLNKDRYTDYDFAKKSNEQLKSYSLFLKKTNLHLNLSNDFNLKQFISDLEKGLYFESTIPQGYGLGSSAALVAAIYNRFSENKINTKRHLSSEQILQLKNDFSILEGYFHGTSSGVDPLSSYLKYPILINGNNQFKMVGIPRRINELDSAIFLVNTEISRKTGPLVKIFMNKIKKDTYLKSIQNELIPVNNQCIGDIIHGDILNFRNNLKQLSKFQLNNFAEMIPNDYSNVWKEGLASDTYYLKLCGAGGGGFILGFTDNFEISKQKLSSLGKEIIPVYRSNGN